MRSFISIDIPDELKKEVKALQELFRKCDADVRWTRPEAMHLTLKFLGNVEEKQVEEIKTILKEIALQTPLINIKLNGAGVFPNQKAPRVLWVGIIEKDGILDNLQKRMDAELLKIGFEKEKRDFKPHLTLGRIRSQKGKERLVKLLEDAKDKEFGVFTATDIKLMKSELRPEGSVYTELARFGFKRTEEKM
ncbi:MAG: 2'-5' RNA ligase [Nitrospirae bacterium RBG_19FT_COMBO_42_15]|nr:MAG: 2'-5' RNA ligase [Nitrospirae bacterium RBG_19FT_COMBO_42_15]